jgi:hypothetical protein
LTSLEGMASFRRNMALARQVLLTARGLGNRIVAIDNDAVRRHARAHRGPVSYKVDAPTSARKRTIMLSFQIDPFIAAGVFVATAATDAVYVMFTAAVVARRRVPAATWSSVWYLLSSFAVISYTSNWIYVGFAALGSWVGAFATITFLHRTPNRPPPLGPAPG